MSAILFRKLVRIWSYRSFSVSLSIVRRMEAESAHDPQTVPRARELIQRWALRSSSSVGRSARPMNKSLSVATKPHRVKATDPFVWRLVIGEQKKRIGYFNVIYVSSLSIYLLFSELRRPSESATILSDERWKNSLRRRQKTREKLETLGALPLGTPMGDGAWRLFSWRLVLELFSSWSLT